MLQRHISTHSFQERKFSCNYCDKKGFSLKNVTLHEQRHSVSKDFLCQFCDLQFLTGAELRAHTKSHSSYDCRLCNKTLKTRRNWKRHMNTHGINGTTKNGDSHGTTKNFKCLTCGKTFMVREYLVMHQKTHEKREKKFTCARCNKSFFTTTNLRRHILTHVKPQLQCHKCEKSFTLKSELERHNSRIHEEKNESFDCTDCGKSFSERIYLNRHVTRTHSNSNQGIKCNFCHVPFTHKYKLQCHMKTHQEGKFLCVKCNRKFYRSDHLKKQCPECDQCFTVQKTLKRHMKKHLKKDGETGPKIPEMSTQEQDVDAKDGCKKFKCLTSNKTFTQRNTLYRHLKYSKINGCQENVVCNQYKCSVAGCDKSYDRKKTLNRHLKTHLEKDGKTGSNRQVSTNESDTGNLVNGKITVPSQAECIDQVYREKGIKDKDGGLHEQTINEVEVIDEEDVIGDEQVIDGKQSINDEQEANLVHHKTPPKDTNHEVVDLCRDSEEELWEKFDSVINNLKNHLQPRKSKHKSYLQNPVKSHEKKKELKKNFKGNEREKKFAKRSILSLHQEIHKKERKQFPCITCKKSYTSKDNLRRHALTHGSPEFECDICLKRFYLNCDLKKHSVIHQEKVTFYHCSTCSKAFSQPNYLKRHIARIHPDHDQSVKCTICDMLFTHKYKLQSHMKTHQEGKFGYANCERKFYRSDHLKKHVCKTLKQCPKCGQCFALQKTLKRHMKKHSCSQTFTLTNMLKQHIVKHGENYGIKNMKQSKSSISKVSHKTFIKSHTSTDYKNDNGNMNFGKVCTNYKKIMCSDEERREKIRKMAFAYLEELEG